jgi:hypothetical protein
MLEVLRNGKSNMKNDKYSDIVKSMQWRQKHLGSDIYPISLDNRTTLNFKQVENGETSGAGTGATLWPAAHVLSKFLEHRCAAVLRGARVCDVGSGTGCAGIVAAALGARQAVLTDQHCVFFLLEENKRRVCRENPWLEPDSISLELYDWGGRCDHLNPPFDLVLVSDCVLPKLYPIEPLVQVSIITVYRAFSS